MREKTVVPLIHTARTNVRELLSDLLSDFAWPVLCALIVTHVTSILLVMCLLRCARTALAKCGFKREREQHAVGTPVEGRAYTTGA